jgi:hypothetical protein
MPNSNKFFVRFTVDEANTIDLKLFPMYDDPPIVNDHEVPVLIVDLSGYVDKHWDMTMRRILPFINGINSVKRISKVSEVNPKYVRLAVQHLM